ncbi:hypothetical protein KDD30_23215 (plasmid) [Photobacterium sp. GJ3]|uniref:hypothetical protein n=1 Tax=Photobacterium sp. GJ3 TaxID=2829502 RepID=UPI001B8B0581|nr:hypothetical protein [Photobacterium sp. GJ3]QUJ69646.1 hypothetical protein KDD30_23215 [Photobacterium sp. GJ3]
MNESNVESEAMEISDARYSEREADRSNQDHSKSHGENHTDSSQDIFDFEVFEHRSAERLAQIRASLEALNTDIQQYVQTQMDDVEQSHLNLKCVLDDLHAQLRNTMKEQE